MPPKALQYRLKKESGQSSGVVSQTDIKGLLQILEANLQSPTRTDTVLVS